MQALKRSKILYQPLMICNLVLFQRYVRGTQDILTWLDFCSIRYQKEESLRALPFDKFIYSSHKCSILERLFAFLSTTIVRTALFVITAPFSFCFTISSSHSFYSLFCSSLFFPFNPFCRPSVYRISVKRFLWRSCIRLVCLCVWRV